MSSNIPKLRVNETVNRLSTCYERLIEANLPLKEMPSVMLWGPPGIGKSQLIRQLANSLQNKTKKKTTKK